MVERIELLIRVDKLDQLFNAPAIDPFSDKPAIVLGEAALMYAVRQQLGRGLLKWRVTRMIIQLPADQITPGLEAQVAAAVRRYTEYKHEENQILIRFSRWQSIVRLTMAVLFVLAILLIANVLANGLLASVSSTVAGLLGGFLTIIIWATVWGPWDKLVYEWLEPALENYLLRRIAKSEIVLQPEPQKSGGETMPSVEPSARETPHSSQPMG